MASTKTNITMIRNLKAIYSKKIHEFYSKKISKAGYEYREEFEKFNKLVVRDIELYVESNYPYLAKKPKCGYHASHVTTSEIQVSFDVKEIPTDYIANKKAIWEEYEARKESAYKRLENWEEQAIRDAVAKSEIPPFEVE